MEYRVRAGETASSRDFEKFLKEIEERINADTELIESIKKDNRLLFAEIQRIADKAKPEYAGTAIFGAIQKTPRYSYIKNVEHDGRCYDVEIDALTRTFKVI